MELNTVDARGRSCPEPVVLTRQALGQSPNGVQVIVCNTTARDNVKRYAECRGYSVEAKDSGDDFVLAITK